jgi:hypothetical protein
MFFERCERMCVHIVYLCKEIRGGKKVPCSRDQRLFHCLLGKKLDSASRRRKSEQSIGDVVADLAARGMDSVDDADAAQGLV